MVTTAFIIVLRRALRWGVVSRDRGANAASAGARALFPVGRMGAFVIAVMSTYGFAYLMMELGASAEWAGYRVSGELVARSAVYGTLFVIAVWSIAAMMPLDVVVDDAGLTFAGATLPWAKIRGAKRIDAWTLAVANDARELRLGPGRREAIDALEAAITAHARAAPPAD